MKTTNMFWPFRLAVLGICAIIKEKMQTDKRDRLQKIRTAGQDNVPLFVILPFIKLLENQYFPDIMKRLEHALALIVWAKSLFYDFCA